MQEKTKFNLLHPSCGMDNWSKERVYDFYQELIELGIMKEKIECTNKQ